MSRFQRTILECTLAFTIVKSKIIYHFFSYLLVNVIAKTLRMQRVYTQMHK